MTPWDVAADAKKRKKFLVEVAYRDGQVRDEDMQKFDLEILSSPAGHLAIAWLWPCQAFNEAFDLENSAQAGAEDRWRRQLGMTFENFVGEVVDECFKSEELQYDNGGGAQLTVLNYIQWAADLSWGDLVRLGEGYIDEVSYIVRIAQSLHLEFSDNEWKIGDPTRLRLRIDHATVARSLAEKLRWTPIKQLENLAKKLPMEPEDPVPENSRVTYVAPIRGRRYRALFDVLAANKETSPCYRIEQLDDILTDAGEAPLPEIARTDASWWTRTGSSASSQPQVSAWHAAGYRAGEVFRDLLDLYEVGEMMDDSDISGHEPSTEITRVRFESLLGRREWLKNPDRLVAGKFRTPDRVSLSPLAKRPNRGHRLTTLVEIVQYSGPDGEPMEQEVFKTLLHRQHSRHALKHQRELLTASRTPPTEQPIITDPNVETIVSLIKAAGELDRKGIEGEFSISTAGSPEETEIRRLAPHETSREIKNLLTKARRQGLIRNGGTSRKPRWVVIGSPGDYVLRIAEKLNFECPPMPINEGLPLEFVELVHATMLQLTNEAVPGLDDDPISAEREIEQIHKRVALNELTKKFEDALNEFIRSSEARSADDEPALSALKTMDETIDSFLEVVSEE